MIFPCKVLNGLVPALSNRGKIAVVVPTPQHVDQTEKKWNQYVKESIIIPASPYGSQDDLDAAARAAAKMDVDLVVMDCIGYNIGMKEQFQKLSGKRVILVPDTCSPGYDGTAVIRGGEMRGTGGNWKKYFNKLHECQTGRMYCSDR